MNHFSKSICLILTDSNNRKQENPRIFNIKSIGDNPLKKLNIDTIRNPIVTIKEIILALFIINNLPIAQVDKSYFKN